MDECVNCGAPGGYPYCSEGCRIAGTPDPEWEDAMPQPTPVWWSRIVREAGRRRYVTGQYLRLATPSLIDGGLRITFHDAEVARNWVQSGAQETLEAALKSLKLELPVAAFLVVATAA
jgi:hypothetical protein